MPQRLRVLATLIEALGLVLSVHTGELTNVYNSSSRASDSLLWPPQPLYSCSHTQNYK